MKKKLFKLATGLMLMMVMLLTVLMCFPAYETQAATVSTEAALKTELSKSGTATITLSSDVSVTGTLEVKGTKTINGGGHTIKYAGPDGGTLIEIKDAGVSLTINNAVFDGNSHKAGFGIHNQNQRTSTITFNSGTMKNFYACAILSAGNLTINGGTFTNNGASGINPGIQFSGPTLKITGGEFCNSVAGAGLKIDLEKFPNSGYTQTATISGGSFHDNATNGVTVGCTNLGVVTNGKSNLTITGGSFYNNTYNGISVMPEATVTVTPSSAVKVYGNKSVGIYDKGTVTFNGSDASKALVYGNTTYGVYVEGTLKFNNGKIYGTTSTSQKYGVYVKDGGEATLYSGASISGNTQNGLYIASGGKATSAAAITDNGGSGVSNSGTLTMNGGSSKNNKSYGVYNNGTFKMSSGTISGNQSYGVYNGDSTTITGGVVENNSGAYGDAYHVGNSFTLTGTSGSTSSVKGYIYIYNSSGGTTYKERYVITNSLSPVINVRPCLYVDHGKIIQTSSAAYAETQSGSTLYPKTGWHLKTSGSNVLMCDCHVVKFQDYDGTSISSKTYHYGDTVTVPTSPTRAQDNTYTYSFSGWSPTVSTTCKGAATYTAAYNKTYREYAVVFKDYDGTVISSKNYHYGDTVTVPTSPTRAQDNTYTYSFSGWSPTVSTTCKGAATYTAAYNKTYREYAVVFKDYDGTVISSKNYHYGDTVTVPTSPTRAQDNTYTYSFSGWSPTVSTTCKGAATYTAGYNKTYREYAVVFKDYDGTVISSKNYHYGDTVTVPTSPTRAQDNTYTYFFSGWSPTVSTTCKGAATYTAGYNKTYREYAVVFKDYDGTVISSKNYHYGDTVTVPTSPTRPDEGRYSYVFNDWTPTVSPTCKGAATYTADYAEIDNGLPPDILYDETVIGESGAIDLYLPEKDGWYNAKTIKQIKQFSASDIDGDMTFFAMYDADTGALLAEGTGDGSKKVITYDFAVEGVKKYRFVSKDMKNGKVKVTERTVQISADFTVPVLTGDPGTEDATSGNSGLTDSGTASWSTVMAKGDDVLQTATDSLSGIVKLAVYPFSKQSTPIQTMLTEPFKSNIKMSDFPNEIGYVIKAWDKAGNSASKLVINSDNLKVRVEITLPRENFDK